MEKNVMQGNEYMVNTKEELMELLKRHEGILSRPAIDYLDSLINLEFSVVRNYILEDDRKILAELEIYKRVAIYNIYHRALRLFNEKNIPHSFCGNKNGLESLIIDVPLDSKYSVKVFNFDYKRFLLKGDFSESSKYRNMEIGDISLYQFLENEESRQAELNSLMIKIKKLEEKIKTTSCESFGGIVYINWPHIYAEELEKIRKDFRKLDSKKTLTDWDKRLMDITSNIYNMVLEDYGLTSESFEEVESSYEETKLQRTLINRQPNLTIMTNVRYL